MHVTRKSSIDSVSATSHGETDRLIADQGSAVLQNGTRRASNAQEMRTHGCGLRALVNWVKSLFRPSIRSLVDNILTVHPKIAWGERVAIILQRFKAENSENFEILYTLEIKMAQVRSDLAKDIAGVRQPIERTKSVLVKIRSAAFLHFSDTLDSESNRIATALLALPSLALSPTNRVLDEKTRVLFGKLQTRQLTEAQFEKHTLSLVKKYCKTIGAKDRKALLKNFKNTAFAPLAWTDKTVAHGSIGKETANQKNSVQIAKLINEKQIAYLESQKPAAGTFTLASQDAAWSAPLNERQALAEAYNKAPHKWVTSQHERDAMKKAVSFQDYKEAYAPALINQHVHSVKANGSKIVMNRCGGMQDERMGLLSRGLLEVLAKAKFTGDAHNTDQSLILAAREKASDPGLKKQLDYLLKLQRKAEKGKLNEKQMQVLKSNLESLSNPESALAAMKCTLNDQALAMIMDAVEGSPKNAFEAENFVMVRQLLLNHTMHSIDKAGRVNCEGNKMENERATFDFLYGKKLVYDKNGPFIDLEGNIHLANQDLEGKNITFRPLVACISPQGHIKNDGPQASINATFFDRAKESGKDFDEIQKSLDKDKKGSAKLAVALGLASTKAGCAFSIGCASAKDRTGLVCGRIAFEHMRDSVKSPGKDTKKDLKKAEARILQGGMATEIIFKNILSEKIAIYDPRALYFLSLWGTIKHLFRTAIGASSMKKTL